MVAPSSMTWQVDYARLMRTPRHPPPPGGGSADHPISPLFTVRSGNKRRRSSGGDPWLKTSCKAVLKLIATGLDGDAVLRLCLQRRPVEVHFISMLHFSWPQMSCASQTLVRGSRTVFASYKDSAGQIQKFALRFLNASESQSFVNSLKDGLKYVTTVGSSNRNVPSQVQSPDAPSTCPSTDRLHPTTNQEPVDEPLPSDRVRHPSSEENRLPTDHQGTHPNVPLRSTASHPDPRTEVWHEMQKVSQELDIKCPFAKYLNGSSFQAMLNKVERVIFDMGGDMALMP